MPTRIPLAPPVIQDAKRPEPLDEKQEEKYSSILKYFSAGDYDIPGLGEDAKLTEKEKFWLVRSKLHVDSWADLRSSQTNECLIRCQSFNPMDIPN